MQQRIGPGISKVEEGGQEVSSAYYVINIQELTSTKYLKTRAQGDSSPLLTLRIILFHVLFEHLMTYSII